MDPIVTGEIDFMHPFMSFQSEENAFFQTD